MSEISLNGIPSSSGISIGKAVILDITPSNIASVRIQKKEIPNELILFINNINSTIKSFEKLIKELSEKDEIAKTILESNIMIVSDEFLKEAIIESIEQGYSAAFSISKEFEKQEELLLKTDDKILKEKAVELKNIKIKLLEKFNTKKAQDSFDESSIIISKSVTTSDLFRFRKYNIAGFITEDGGLTSHASILSRSFDIPSIVGAKDICQKVKPNDEIVINGFDGKIIINPNIHTKKDILNKISIITKHKKDLGKLVNLKTKTKDNREITLSANIEIKEDVGKAILSGAEAIGLVRTENTFNLNNDLYDEKAQYEEYKAILEAAYPKNVTFRLFDFGSDKQIDDTHSIESNPALGLRGIRFLIQNPDILKIQLRALLKAGVNKNLQIMIPMVTTLSEVNFVKNSLNEISNKLKKEKEEHVSNCPLGIMIETPASVLLSDSFAKNIDFFSIGTNDLIQYLLATDRVNEDVSKYYDIFSPAISKAIFIVVNNAKKHNVSVGLCGELAGDLRFTKLLIGLGIKELSATSSKLLEVKNQVLANTYTDAINFADQILNIDDSSEIEKLLSNL